jgi:CubicO group peptidase (beta-lactamase class C family)
MRRFLRWIFRGFIVLIAGAAAWLYFLPPDLIRVGAGYSAKIVCSNVFLAGRDATQVLADDVQAPGHPILKLMKVTVDKAAGTVSAGLAGVFGKQVAVYRKGYGCSVIPDGYVAMATRDAFPVLPDDGPALDASALWPVGNRADVSQDPAIAAVLDDAALQGPGMRAIVVAQNGRIIGERYGAGFTRETPLLGWSMTKTVNAGIIGTLVRDGKLALDKKALFAEWASDGRKEIALSDLLAMSSGLAFNEDYGDVTDVTRMLFLENDMAAFARDKPLARDIGKTFNYSSGTAVLLSRIWQDAAGDKALTYPKAALFKPLGMSSATFETDASGTLVGSSHLYANAPDWAKFAQMLLDKGMVNGAQLLPADYVAMMHEPAPASVASFGAQYGKGQLWLQGPSGGGPDDQDPDLGFALPDDAYWMLGHDGQSICIIPSRNMLVLRMGLTPSKLHYKPQALVQRLLGVVK